MRLNPIQLAGPSNPSAGYFYADLMAMYTGNAGATLTDPENSLSWALRDSKGNPVYINFNVPAQMAADPSNPAWQSRLVEWLETQCRLGYWGLQLDDVNFTLDSLTATPMLNGQAATNATWAAAVCACTKAVQASLDAIFPNLKIIHNTPWYKSDPADWPSCDYLMKENGFTDGGLTGGTGSFSLSALSAWVASVHAAGKAVHWLENYGHLLPDQLFSIAMALILTNGSDLWEDRILPASSYAYTDCGNAQPAMRHASGLWSRQFDGALVLALEPGAAPLPYGGQTLQPRQGLIIQA